MSTRAKWVFVALSVFVAGGCADDDSMPDADAGTDGTSSTGSTGMPGTGTGTGTDGSESDTDAEASTGEAPQSGCDGTPLRELPANPGDPGPWAVGARTVQIDGLQVEVWYPAPPGSQSGVDPVVYDIREQLPESEQEKIPDADNPAQTCDCYPELPVDDAYGPYPVVMFVHGTAGFRSQSLPQMVHWASHGFVVMAADHPGLKLGDMLGLVCGSPGGTQDMDGDLMRMLAALTNADDAVSFIVPHVDLSRVGLSGHSAGGRTVESLGDLAQVLIPMAAGGTNPGSMLQSSLVLGGTADSVVDYQSQVDGYEASPSPKRLVGIDNAGHLAFAELCTLQNDEGQDLLEIAAEYDVCGAQLAGGLFQCSDTLTPDEQSWAVIDHVSTAVLHEVLHCQDATAALQDLQNRFPVVAEFRQDL